MRYPSPLREAHIPYVIGPVGGGLTTPAGFESEDTAPWYQRLRALDSWRLRHDRALKATYEGAACVLGIAPYVEEALSALRLNRFEVLSETALPSLPDVPARAAVSISADRPLRLLFVGRVIRTKGARDLVAAMAHLQDIPVVVDIIGDGFDLDACRDLAERLAVTERVIFHGRKQRREVDSFYARADVFVFPSFREPGGNVVFEAMGHHLPLIVCGRGGPGAAVDDECAIALEGHDPSQLARDIATAVRTLASDAALRRRMGEAAHRRVGAVGLWEPKLDRVVEIYSMIKSAAVQGV
jgi:glycosyltransferase involved in cell wall biosynthesis